MTTHGVEGAGGDGLAETALGGEIADAAGADETDGGDDAPGFASLTIARAETAGDGGEGRLLDDPGEWIDGTDGVWNDAKLTDELGGDGHRAGELRQGRAGGPGEGHGPSGGESGFGWGEVQWRQGGVEVEAIATGPLGVLLAPRGRMGEQGAGIWRRVECGDLGVGEARSGTMAGAVWRIGLAAVRNVPTVEERLATVDRFLGEAAARGAAIVCFPEAYIPGLRGFDFAVPAPDQCRQREALEAVRVAARAHGVATVIGMEWASSMGRHNVAFVISGAGEIMGYQAKNQIPREEEAFYVPDGRRRLFEVDGVPFGIAICHEGWRYPESVRWAATRGAQLVFQPQLTGSDRAGVTIERWGDPDSPYYEKAMIARGVENTIYFASVNYALRYQDSATSVIGPEGECLAAVPYGEEELLVHDVDLARATGLCARRFNPALYPPA